MNLIDLILAKDADQKSAAWHDIRLGRFTSSEIAKLIGEPKTKNEFGLTETAQTYILSKIAEQLTGVHQEITGAALDWGNDQEIICKQELIALGYDIKEKGFIPYGDNAGGSPDGIITTVNGVEMILEVKSPWVSTNHIKHLLIRTPEQLKANCKEYYYQIQSNMLFAGLSSALFVSFDPRMKENRIHTLTVPLVDTDAVIIQTALARAENFKQSILKLI